MRVGLKLFRLLALMACVSLVIAGGNWIHHDHVEAAHSHHQPHLIDHDHAHLDGDHSSDVAPFESFIHCGSDLVWVSKPQNPIACPAIHARAEFLLAPVIAVHLQVEEPPPRLIALRTTSQV